jgi:hypothetical protein
MRIDGGARSSSVNNLKQIGLAIQNHNDCNFCLPHNGGHTDPVELEAINFGWHNPNIRYSGTWATQILPFMEQDPLFRNVKLDAEDANEIPDWILDKANAKAWQVTVRNYNCAGRGRQGFKIDAADGNYPGVVTDYAINLFLNSPPTRFNSHGFALDGGLAVAPFHKIALQDLPTPAQTIIIGGKALPQILLTNDQARDGDEGIFSPGNYIADHAKTIVHSTGTGRGHWLDPKGNARPGDEFSGVPWMYCDEELRAAKPPNYLLAWGSPFKGGTLFCFCDGTVRMLNYDIRGTAEFAKMLYGK